MEKTLFILCHLPLRKSRMLQILMCLFITTCLFAQESAVFPFTGALSSKDQIKVDFILKLVAVKRVQVVTLDQTKLRFGTFRMDLFEDIAIKCDTTSRRIKNGAIIITGKTTKDNQTGEFLISIFGKNTIVMLTIGNRSYHISQLSGNTCLVSEVDPSLLHPCGTIKGGEK